MSTGKVASVAKSFRQGESARVKHAIGLINHVDRPKLYHDQNGRGARYYTVKYRVPGRLSPASVYLGCLPEDDVRAIQAEIARVKDAYAAARAVLALPVERVGALHRYLRSAKLLANEIARRCGRAFKGYTLKG